MTEVLVHADGTLVKGRTGYPPLSAVTDGDAAPSARRARRS